MSLLRNGNVIGGISKTLLSKIGFSDLTTGAQNLCDGVNELNSSKVSNSGDTMMGPLVFKGVNDAIQYTGTQATHSMINFIDNTVDMYGNGISIGGGGTTIIGGGESSDAMVSSLSGGGNELMYIGNDGNVNIFSNLQNGWASRVEFLFDTDGRLTSPGGGGSWWEAKNKASFRKTNYANAGSFYPVTSHETNAGIWSMGSLGNATPLYFSYCTRTNYNNKTNNTEQYRITPKNDSAAHTFEIAHSGNVGTGDSNGQVKIAGTNVGVKGLGTMAYQNTGSYPTTTTVPSGYRIRAGSKVVTVTGAQATVVFTQAQVNEILGTTGCTGSNTVVYVSNGDYGAQSHYISACIYNGSNKTWCMYSVMNGAFTAGNFRATYLIVKFA